LIEWIQIVTSIAGVIIAIALFCVAYSSLDNAKKERRQRYLEMKLKDVYSPLHQIFSIAKGNEEREKELLDWGRLKIVSGVKGSFVFDDKDYFEIKKIYRYNSHYLDDKLRNAIYDKIINESDYSKRIFTPNDLEFVFVIIQSTYLGLKAELEELGVKGKYES
jgi:hypothetical protein